MSNTCLHSISKQRRKKYGANAPQLHPIRCSIDFYVMLCNEHAKKQKIRRKRATIAPYSRRTRRHSKGEGGGVGRWGPLRSPWGLPSIALDNSLSPYMAVGTLAVALGFASTLSFTTLIMPFLSVNVALTLFYDSSFHTLIPIRDVIFANPEIRMAVSRCFC